MLKFQLATNKDLREAAIIDKKQRYEEERKRRIFNARDRILGVRNIKYLIIKKTIIQKF